MSSSRVASLLELRDRDRFASNWQSWLDVSDSFGFSDTSQLIISTGTTIVTFVMVFLIQDAQNRDSLAMQLKLDELLRCMKGARMDMVKLEETSEEELVHLREQFEKLARTKSADAGAPGKDIAHS